MATQKGTKKAAKTGESEPKAKANPSESTKQPKTSTAAKGSRGEETLPPGPSPPVRHCAKIPPKAETKPKRKRGFKPKEDDFIKESYGVLTVRQIADRLGRSKSGIDARISRLGLVDAKREKEKIVSIKKADYTRSSVLSSATSENTLATLEALRDALARAVDTAPSREIARLSRELRDVMKQIDELKKSSSRQKESTLNVIRANFNSGQPKAKAQL
jgi:hypothetical protein